MVKNDDPYSVTNLDPKDLKFVVPVWTGSQETSVFTLNTIIF